MKDQDPRRIEDLVVVQFGEVRANKQTAEGVQVVDASGTEIAPISRFLRNLLVDGCSVATCRSYAMDLLRWWRFLAAINVSWDAASREDWTDFLLWMGWVVPHHGGPPGRAPELPPLGTSRRGYAARTINHNTTVVAGFYDFHIRRSVGVEANPVPADRPGGGRRNAHHDPRLPFDTTRRARGRRRIPRHMPRSVPDDAIDALFMALRSNRDRALVGFYLSTGARANELLGLTGGDVDFGGQRIQVLRKGTGEAQWISGSSDAFVYLRLYLGERRLSPTEPIWLTLRQPFRPLNYHAVRAVFVRANKSLGTRFTLHQLRHTAAYRMVQDPNLSLSDVQRILGHAYLSTTQIYTEPHDEDVLMRMAQYHRDRGTKPRQEFTAPEYNTESLDILLGRKPRD